MRPYAALLGDLLREWRKSYGETREQFAVRVDATVPSLRRWETGKACPSAESLEAVVLHAEPSYVDTARAWRLWSIEQLDPRARRHVEVLPRGWERRAADAVVHIAKLYGLPPDFIELLSKEKRAFTSHIVRYTEGTCSSDD
jgi:transcriptional regulator with XRE-family HTH domain